MADWNPGHLVRPPAASGCLRAPRRRRAARCGIVARALAFWLGTFGVVFADAPTGGDGWSIGPTPDWVDSIEPFSAAPSPVIETERPRGIDVRLLERQIDLRGNDTASWYATERAFLTRSGVADHSRYEITFDPTYQSVELQELSLLRDGRVLDRLAGVRGRLLDTEPDLRSALYYGNRTLSLLIDDVRVGDVLRVAFTRTGNNPILDGLREHGFSTDRSWKTEGRSRLRVLSDADRPLHVRTEGPVPEPVESVVDGIRTLVVDQASTPARPTPQGLPARALDDGQVVISDIADWRGVADWARPLYALDEPIPADLEAVAARIRTDHDDRAERVGAALRWVQEEIRYFGIEMGADSHRPASAVQTLGRRFGDCKGKALLLMTLLGALGVDSHAALVDSDGRIESPTHPWRLHAFDHVIVHLVHDGVAHWLDPTLSHQRGALGDLHEPDYGMALVLAPGVDALVPMTPERNAAAVVTSKWLVVSDEPDTPDTIEIRTRFPAAHAAYLRREIEREGLQALDETYLDYYDRLLDGVQRAAPLERAELPDGGLELVERYTLDFWDGDGSEVRRRTLRASELDDEIVELVDVEDTDRPFSILGARHHVERWMITLPRAVEVRQGQAHHETPWFQLDETVSIDEDGTTATVTTRFEPLADEVAANEAEAYRIALEALYDAVTFELVDRPPPTPFERFARAVADHSDAEAENDVVAVAEMGAVAAGLLAVGIAVVRRRRERVSGATAARPAVDGASDDALTAPHGAVKVVSSPYRLSSELRRQVLADQCLAPARPLARLTLMMLLLVAAATGLVYMIRGDLDGLDAWVPLLGVIGVAWTGYAIVLGITVVRSGRAVRDATEYQFELDTRRFVECGSDGTRVELLLDELVGVKFDPRWIILGESAVRVHILPRVAFASEADWERAHALLQPHATPRAPAPERAAPPRAGGWST